MSLETPICAQAETAYFALEQAVLATLYAAKTLVITFENTFLRIIQIMLDQIATLIDLLNKTLKSKYNSMIDGIPNASPYAKSLKAAFCDVLSKCKPVWEMIFNDVDKTTTSDNWWPRQKIKLQSKNNPLIQPMIIAVDVILASKAGGAGKFMEDLVNAVNDPNPLTLYDIIESTFCNLSLADLGSDLIDGMTKVLDYFLEYYEKQLMETMDKVRSKLREGLAWYQHNVIDKFSEFMKEINKWAECAFSLCNLGETAANLKQDTLKKLKYVDVDTLNNWSINYTGKLASVNNYISDLSKRYEKYQQDKIDTLEIYEGETP